MMGAYLVIQSARFVSVQDDGRWGYEHYGISVNGAADGYAFRMANELVGNAGPEPAIEITAFDFAMTTSVDVRLCVTGAPAELKVGPQPVSAWEPFVLPAGEKLSVGKIRKGLRVYISVAGGIDAPLLLGSCAADSALPYGGYLTAGQRLKLKNPEASAAGGRKARNEEIPQYGSPWHIRVCEGPDTGSFREQLRTLFESVYTVSPVSNTVGLRLNGPPLTGHRTAEVLSRGVSIGAIEVFPTGQAAILHKGRTVTAGYPVVGVVASADLDKVGQARPGDEIRFSPIDVGEAERLYKLKFGKFGSTNVSGG